MSFIKHCGALVAGLIAAVVLVGGIEALSSLAYPPPEGMDLNNQEEMAAFVSTLPLGAFLFVLAAWSAGSFGGSSLATLIAPNRNIIPGLVVVCFLFTGGIMTLFAIPHPSWFWVAGIASFPVFGGLGLWLSHKRGIVLRSA